MNCIGIAIVYHGEKSAVHAAEHAVESLPIVKSMTFYNGAAKREILKRGKNQLSCMIKMRGEKKSSTILSLPNLDLIYFCFRD